MAAQHKGAGHDLPSANGVSVAEHVDMENTRELSLMRAFAQRRRPKDTRLVAQGNGPSAAPLSPVEEAEPKKKKKKKNIKKRLSGLITCLPKGAKADMGGHGTWDRNGGVSPACADQGDTQPSKGVDELTTMLIELANSSFIPPEIETDAEDGEIEKLAGLLLRQCGDTVAEDYDCANLFTELLSNYSVFGKLMSTVFHKIGLPTNEPGHRGPKGSDKTIKTNVAVTCEVASRLSAMDTHPMSRALGFGARYLKEHYPLEEALNADEEPDIDKNVE